MSASGLLLWLAGGLLPSVQQSGFSFQPSCRLVNPCGQSHVAFLYPTEADVFLSLTLSRPFIQTSIKEPGWENVFLQSVSP